MYQSSGAMCRLELLSRAFFPAAFFATLRPLGPSRLGETHEALVPYV